MKYRDFNMREHGFAGHMAVPDASIDWIDVQKLWKAQRGMS